jgi:hypothetical protein
MALRQPVVDIRRAFTWLTENQSIIPPISVSALSPSIQILLSELDKAVEKLDRAKVWRIIKRLLYMGAPQQNTGGGIKSNENLLGYINLRCALAYYDMGHLQDSKQSLMETIGLYTQGGKYQQALVLWMKGYVLWQMPEGHEEATLSWQRSINMLEDLELRVSGEPKKEKFLNDCLNEMKKSLELCIEEDGLPKQELTAVPLWRILDEIPQDTRKLSELVKPETPRVYSNQFWIKNQFCILRVLDSTQPFIYIDNHLVVKVVDDEMKAAYIFKDDYVLIHEFKDNYALVYEPKEPIANDQLVLVTLHDIDTKKTVVRYHRSVTKDGKTGVEFSTLKRKDPSQESKVKQNSSLDKQEANTEKGSSMFFEVGDANYRILGEVIGVFHPTRCSWG